MFWSTAIVDTTDGIPRTVYITMENASGDIFFNSNCSSNGCENLGYFPQRTNKCFSKGNYSAELFPVNL